MSFSGTFAAGEGRTRGEVNSGMISDGEGKVPRMIKHSSHPWVSFLDIVLIIIYIHTWPIDNLSRTLNYHC